MPPKKMIATYWSINAKVPPVLRYHLGQLSVAQYADSVVRAGASHYAVICDNEGLGPTEYLRIHEIGSAINCLCDTPLVVRTLTSLTDMDAEQRIVAQAIAERLRTFTETLRKAYPRTRIVGLAQDWRSGRISDGEFLEQTHPVSVLPELKKLPEDQSCGLVYLLSCSPTWYDDFWFVSTIYAVGRLSKQCGGPMEIVEGHRNRYLWLALQAVIQLLEIPSEWLKWSPQFDFRPNIEADGPRGYMCLDDIKHALLVHSSQADVLRFCESTSDRSASSINRLLLGRDSVRDRRSLGHELWNLFMKVQDRWFFGTSPAEGSSVAFTLDPLLGIYDRGKFDRDLVELVAMANRASPVSLLMIDLDHFKRVNDTYGHPVGDSVLKKAASLTNSISAGRGFCYRYGGEEIAVLLPNYTVDEAVALAERLRRVIYETDFQPCTHQISVSIGVAAFPATAKDSSELLERADHALYDAKNSGRDKVCQAPLG